MAVGDEPDHLGDRVLARLSSDGPPDDHGADKLVAFVGPEGEAVPDRRLVVSVHLGDELVRCCEGEGANSKAHP